MLNAWVLMSIGIIVVSFFAGLIVFYVTIPLSKDEKKKQLEEMTSLLINFIIFIWIGKILIHINVFIKDPLAILAYPSNSYSFYIAIVLLSLNILYKMMRHQFKANSLFASFVPTFLASSFVYEFIQIIWNEDSYLWGYLGLLMVLLLIYFILQDRVLPEILAYSLMSALVLGQLMLAFVLPYTTVFGYTMAPWFLIIILILCLAGFFYNIRKKVA